MKDDSPIVVKIKKDGKYYNFFLLTVDLYNTFAFGPTYDPSVFSKEFLEKFPFERHNELISLFSSDTFVEEDKNSFTSLPLSLIQVMSLLEITGSIVKHLLFANNDNFKTFVANEFSMPVDWDVHFLKSAEFIFSEFKERFKDHPRIIEIILRFTNVDGKG